MIINNLTQRDRIIADILWSTESMDDLKRVVRGLSREDQLRANALVEIVALGGDEVASVADAQQYLERFRIQNG